MTNASKGHLMKRGTLMVLKRLLVTALSALGLGALAAGTASGQSAGDGNIPAPDIFDDQITCSMNVPTAMDAPMPTVVPMGGMTTPLDDAIMALLDSDDPMANPLADSDTLGLGYVIPPTGANCGRGAPATGATVADQARQASFISGYDENGDGMFDGENDVAPTSSVPADVAQGYSLLLDAFKDVYGDPGMVDSTGKVGALQDAQKALADAIEAGQSGAVLTPLQNAVTRAQEALSKSRAAFNDIAGGPINQAGVAEWMAKSAVTQAIKGINDQAVKADTAKDALDAMDFSMWVPLANQELFDSTNSTTVVNIADGMGTVDRAQLVQYANGDLANPQVAMVDSMTGVTDSSQSNFLADGTLIVPMVDDPDSDTEGDTILLLDTTNNGVDDIRMVVENANIAAAAIKKARDDNVAAGGINQEVFDVAYMRAQAEANYYNEQWAKVLADNTDTRSAQDKLRYLDTDSSGVNEPGEQTEGNLNTGYEPNVISIASRNAEYTTEKNKLFTAEQTLRQAVDTREAATAAVRAAFTSPQSFYEQLVSRRQAKKVLADRAVASASEDGGTPTDAQTKAAEDAAKALMAAEEAQASFAGLFDNPDDPTVALINELLKNGPEGDDGGALVKAISDTYDVAAGAADAAREVVNELTGEGGAVAMNTAAISENANDITSLDGRVSANEEEIGMDENGMSRIDHNETRSMMNRTMIMTNAENIATNAENITTNAGNIMANSGRIDQNEMDIMTNAGNIASNTAAIGMNTGAIADLGNRVGSNESAIQRNSGMIGELSESLEVVRAGVAASMALAGMPAINGRGISIGVGSYDGESAFAVGFQIQGEMASFKVGVTSAGGETGASAGVGFQF